MELKDYQPVREMPKRLIEVPVFIGQLEEAFLSKYETARNENLSFKFENGIRIQIL